MDTGSRLGTQEDSSDSDDHDHRPQRTDESDEPPCKKSRGEKQPLKID